MPGTAEALGVLLLLSPGFCCAFIVQRLAVRAKQTELDKLIEALLFSFFLYLISSPFFGYSLPLVWQKKTLGNIEQYTFQFNWLNLLVLGLFAVVVGVFFSANLNRDWLLRVFRKFHVTQRTARSSIWNDAFQDIPSSCVLVQLSGGRSIVGFLRYYSDEPDEASLFLEDAAWIVNEDGTQQPIDGPGILITKQTGIESVSFLNAQIRNTEPDIES
jgi:hypothetical protein